MIKHIFLALLQAASEFLPISSSGHLALFGNLFNDVNVFYYVVLHLASLLAIVIYTRREIWKLVTIEKGYEKMWLYVLIGILPAGLFGLFFRDMVKGVFSSTIFIGLAFIGTAIMLFVTHGFEPGKQKLDWKKSLAIGVAQVAALFPGVSRSGTTISFGIFAGLSRVEAFRFSFLMSIPLILGATILEFENVVFSTEILVGFFVCAITSFFFLMLLEKSVEKNMFWLFGVYLLIVGLITLIWL
ncbi:MAG: undecaprenyl-diphosphatase [Patescibacteria group bacterium]|jgi:undecaprenyl-diphosphatase